VVLVERDEVGRRGRAEVMRLALGAFWEVEAREPTNLSSKIAPDVLVVVVRADGAGFDRFDVIQAMCRAKVGSGSPQPVVIAARAEGNPLLDVRLLQGGSHHLVSVDDLQRSDDGAIMRLIEDVSGIAPGAAKGPGIARTVGTDPESVLKYVADNGLESVFAPGISQADLDLSRRAVARVRQDIAGLGGIRSSLTRYTGGSDRNVDLPTWREVVAYVNCARGMLPWAGLAGDDGSGPRIGTLTSGLPYLTSRSALMVA